MNNKYGLVMAFAVIVVILIAGYLLFAGTNQKNGAANNTLTQTKQTAKQAAKQTIPDTTITLNGSGFNPETVTIKTDGRVVWENKSGAAGTVNSDNHPTNLLFPFLNLGRFNNGENVTAVFNKPGKYTYHNELNPDQKGTIVVE